MGFIDSLLVKYGAVMNGYVILGLPLFGPNSANYKLQTGTDYSIVSRDYMRNVNMLINLSKAIGRMVITYKDVQNLAGYTLLITELNVVLTDLDQGSYKKNMLQDS